MLHLLASLFAFTGLLAGRIANPDREDFIEWRTVAEDAISAGKEWTEAWKERK